MWWFRRFSPWTQTSEDVDTASIKFVSPWWRLSLTRSPVSHTKTPVWPCWRRRWRRCFPYWPENPFPASSLPASCRGHRNSPGGPRRTPAAHPGCPCRTRSVPEVQKRARNRQHQRGKQAEIRLKTHLVEERMPGHVKDVHFDFSVSNLHPGNTHTLSERQTWVRSSDAALELTWWRRSRSR